MGFCCTENNSNNRRPQQRHDGTCIVNGAPWSEKIMGFDHTSTISDDKNEKDLIQMYGEAAEKK